MGQFPIPENEASRLVAVRALLGSPSLTVDVLETYVELASKVFQSPIAFISLMDEDHQTFAAKRGFSEDRIARQLSFCAHTICAETPFVIEDASLDSRFFDHPLVISGPKIRFYAAIPLIDFDGNALGTIGVIDAKPRAPTQSQLEDLELLARKVTRVILSCLDIEGANSDGALHRPAVSEPPPNASMPTFSVTLGPTNDVLKCGYRTHPDSLFDDTCLTLEELFDERSGTVTELADVCRSRGLTIKVESPASQFNPEFSPAFAINLFPESDGNVRIVGTHPHERLYAESVIRLQQEQYRHIIENVEDIVFCTDPDTTLTFLNPAWQRSTGFGVNDSLYRRLYEYVPEEYQNGVESLFRLVSSGFQGSCGIEIPIINSSGFTTWVLAHVKPLRTSSGELLGFTGSMHDLTERKEAETAEQARLEFAELLSAVSAEFIDIDPEFVGAAITKAIEAIGTLGDLDGVHVALISEDGQSYGIAHEWVREHFRSVKLNAQGIPLSARPWLWEKLLALEPIQMVRVSQMPESAAGERAFLREAGIESFVTIPLVSHQLCHGFVTYYVRDRLRIWAEEFTALLSSATASISAVLMRAKAERAVRTLTERQIATSQLRVEMALNCADIVLFTLDRFGRVTFAQGRMLSAIMDTRGCTVGKSAYQAFKDRIVIEHILAAFLGDEREETHETQGRFLTTRYTPIRNSNGQIDGVIGISVDVTKQRNLEQNLRDARRLEAIGALSAGVAHEINTPIHAISANLEFLNEGFQERQKLYSLVQTLVEEVRAEGTFPERCDQISALAVEIDLPMLSKEIPLAIEQSLDAARRVGSIVMSLRELCHPGVVEMIDSDINHLVLNAVNVSRNEWRYVATLDLNLCESLPTCRCHPTDVMRCVLNLIVNAAHAIQDRTDRDEAMGIISITTQRDGDAIEIRVSDDGTGIPEQIRNRIFDPFFTTKEPGRGTGQGLSLAYSTVVERHHGTISVDSELGQGTTFFVRIPINTERVSSAA